SQAFTQGLVWADGVFYEGTGLPGYSSLRKVEIETGRILQLHKLPDEYFAEGITIFGDKIIQLTYQSNVGFVYNKETFELLEEFSYSSEGWGLTHNSEHLIMSNGTNKLYFMDPVTFQIASELEVYDDNIPVWNLNELEYIRGEIYANVWQADLIAIISPKTGNVTGWIDLSGLLPLQDRTDQIDVLNGIAYDPTNKRLFVTGKNWPKLFEIKLIPYN
ncbi:glutaminyl-peptide cyclotransferase, partial [Planctomycetota bacterium]